MANEAYDAAQVYLSNMLTYGTNYLGQLSAINYSAPTLSVTWSSLAPPTLPDVVPDGYLAALPDIAVNMPTDTPAALTIDAPAYSIDDFTDVMDTMTFGVAPTVSYGAAPTIPSAGAVTVPDAPLISLPAEPTFLSLNTVTFAGIDLHADWLVKLDNIPTLALVEPTPYSYSPNPEYTSALMADLKATLLSRMAGGTGLDPAVEQAIWDRARSRETNTALANEAEVMRQSEAFGFALPAGVLAAQLREAQQNYYDKLSDLSREVSIKQADLEQKNLEQTITVALQLEGQLIDYSFKMENLAFMAAKELADNSIQIYNAGVEGFKALLTGYQTYAAAYKTIIDSELAKVEVYKAQLQAEMTKAQINQALVEQYKASISASMSQVEIYKAQVGAAQTLVQLEQTKISAAGEQVRGYVAQINAETAKVEAYKAGVQAEATKVEVYKAKAQAFSAKVGAQAEKAKADLGRYTALLQAKTAEWDGYKARVQTETARIDALGRQSGVLLDGFKIEAAALTAKAETMTKVWETEIKQYEAGQNLILRQGEANNQAWLSTRQMSADAAKTGAQIFGQLTAAALGQVHTSISSGSSMNQSISYSYSGDVNGGVSPHTF